MNPFETLLLYLSIAPCIALVEDDAKNRPVSKVINVLKDMVTQLEKEAEEDEETYEAFACWCETNDKEKTKAIADGEQAVSDLTTAIESFTALGSKLVAEVGTLDKEIAENTEALESSTAMRRKEKAEFNAEEKETLQTIQSLKSAVIALSKHHEASFIQMTASAAAAMEVQNLQTVAAFQHTMRKHTDVIHDLFTPRQRKELSSFMQASQDGLAPASGEIFGMLKQMKESFETNLDNSQKEEMANQKDYEDLKATKEKEIAAATEQVDTKSQQLAKADEKLAESKENLQNSQNTLAADMKFLANLKEQCENMDSEYEERTVTRQQEIGAVGKALEFLNSDEAHDLFSRSFSFIQVKSKLQSQRRMQISRLLAQAARKSLDNGAQMETLSLRARQDAFGAVTGTITDMIDKLTKEKADEIKLKTFCVEELTKNEHDIQEKKQEKADLEAMIEDLKSTIHTLSTEIEELKAQIAELEVQIKRAGDDREKENKQFQIAVADQRATQKLLGMALNILKDFYEKNALVQTDAGLTSDQAPPGFKKMENNAKSGGVMGMMKTIIADSEAVENEAIRGEEDSQKAYEDFVKDSNLSIDDKIKEVVSKSEMKAKAETDKVEKENELEAVEGELESLDNENADLHKSCDFTLKNFDARQVARDDEIQALKQAMAMFNGASFSAFLEIP
jgi:hypothetical protein